MIDGITYTLAAAGAVVGLIAAGKVIVALIMLRGIVKDGRPKRSAPTSAPPRAPHTTARVAPPPQPPALAICGASTRTSAYPATSARARRYCNDYGRHPGPASFPN